ncbi:hypothetical protein BGZ80_002468 [Entomortierella chlamydospora]|uniref:Peptidase A1 domain-containing protein n=1 Tax=Entomortierella chlamydospora TaxID=101097 RepID=A0A9P6N183_9FUNG|nr:hypothetical protein BGZ80_002468 [Entomortierella chlamydospora]
MCKYGISGPQTERVKDVQCGRVPSESGVVQLPLIVPCAKFILSSKNCEECFGTTRYYSIASSTFRLNSEFENGTTSSPSSLPPSTSLPKADTNAWQITYGDFSRSEDFLARDDVTVNNLKSPHEGRSGKIGNGRGLKSGGREVLFGGIDELRIREGHRIVYTPVTRPDIYTRFKNITKGAKITNGAKIPRSNIAGIMDTGTTLMIVPDRLCTAIHDFIPGATKVLSYSWAIPCEYASSTSPFPEKELELEIENHRFATPFEDLVREAVDHADLGGQSTESDRATKPNVKSSTEQGLCFSGIQPSNANVMIIGDLFIKNTYMISDQENQQVGIAPLSFNSPEGVLPKNGSEIAERIQEPGINMRMGWAIIDDVDGEEALDQVPFTKVNSSKDENLPMTNSRIERLGVS